VFIGLGNTLENVVVGFGDAEDCGLWVRNPPRSCQQYDLLIMAPRKSQPTMSSPHQQVEVSQESVAHESNAATSRRRAEERHAFLALLDGLCQGFCQMLGLRTYIVHVLLECCIGSSASQIRLDVVMESDIQAELAVWSEQPASSHHQSCTACDRRGMHSHDTLPRH
jgi:hypothetical protein